MGGVVPQACGLITTAIRACRLPIPASSALAPIVNRRTAQVASATASTHAGSVAVGGSKMYTRLYCSRGCPRGTTIGAGDGTGAGAGVGEGLGSGEGTGGGTDSGPRSAGEIGGGAGGRRGGRGRVGSSMVWRMCAARYLGTRVSSTRYRSHVGLLAPKVKIVAPRT